MSTGEGGISRVEGDSAGPDCGGGLHAGFFLPLGCVLLKRLPFLPIAEVDREGQGNRDILRKFTVFIFVYGTEDRVVGMNAIRTLEIEVTRRLRSVPFS